MKKNSFTLVEILVVIGVMGIIMTFGSVNLLSLRNKASINSTVIQLVADLKQQQTKAMIGEVEDGTPDLYGVHFTSNNYVLFHGTTYSPSNPDNFQVNLEADLSLATANQSIIFKKGNGELETGSINSITITNNASNEQKTITINQFGVITQVN